MKLRSGLVLGVGAAMLAGCAAKEEGVVDLPVATVFERLNAGDMKDFRAQRQCGLLIHFASEAERDKQIRWVVRSSGAVVASFTVDLTPVDANRTRIAVRVPEAPDGGEIYDGGKFYPRPALHQPLRPAIKELIAARLEQREFDVWKIPERERSSEADKVCQVQRAGLEVGGRALRHDGNDHAGRGARSSSGARGGGVSFEPGKPMTSGEAR